MNIREGDKVRLISLTTGNSYELEVREDYDSGTPDILKIEDFIPTEHIEPGAPIIRSDIHIDGELELRAHLERENTFQEFTKFVKPVNIGSDDDPQRRLHIRRVGGGTAQRDFAQLHFTSDTTGHLNSQGFTLGLDDEDNADIRLRAFKPIRFYTNNTLRGTVLGSGVLSWAQNISTSANYQISATTVIDTSRNLINIREAEIEDLSVDNDAIIGGFVHPETFRVNNPVGGHTDIPATEVHSALRSTGASITGKATTGSGAVSQINMGTNTVLVRAGGNITALSATANGALHRGSLGDLTWGQLAKAAQHAQTPYKNEGNIFTQENTFNSILISHGSGASNAVATQGDLHELAEQLTGETIPHSLLLEETGATQTTATWIEGARNIQYEVNDTPGSIINMGGDNETEHVASSWFGTEKLRFRVRKNPSGINPQTWSAWSNIVQLGVS